MNQLRVGVLVLIFVAATGLAWAGSGLWDARGTLPAVPWSAPVVFAMLAGLLFAVALSLRSRLRARRELRPGARPVDPLGAARSVMLGQAAALVSALIGGLYGGVGVFLLLERMDVPARREQALYAGLTVAAAVAVCAAALFLQRVCRLRGDETGQDGDGGPLGSPL
ncbi:DUF3180 domain-containing protein [Streptomyces sp. ST2-7A]|uniref:DUF3180 domain-containing protein n=1 Tax=Streptomyces sp. ST2-7A TaxID=2907214 RepID=UPI001F178891|nr:DUF3180 domain-containing protein [Streptomyces sp. ST2-7A]MCE7083173.1 DUF3180 domain-containing protein [Streptomyces sp. ST2-7A]